MNRREYIELTIVMVIIAIAGVLTAGPILTMLAFLFAGVILGILD